jgi:hypothetical protein
MQGYSPPPMLLKELHWRNDGNVLSELPLLPVPLSFESLQSYCEVFSSLSLHETWASLCQEIETKRMDSLQVLMHSRPEHRNGFNLLKCEVLSSSLINDLDLLTVTVPNRSPTVFFGVARKVVRHSFNRNKDKIDEKLLNSLQKSNLPVSKISFELWITASNVPEVLDSTFTVTKVLRLDNLVKSLIVNAELATSPLCDVILRPKDNPNVFKLDWIDKLEENHATLNSSQNRAVASISTTMVCSLEPKIALLQGPPGECL